VQSKALKLQLIVQGEEQQVLDGQSKICNWLYNHLLDKANQLREQYRETQNKEALIVYTKRGLRNQVPQLKQQNQFLKSVHSSPLKNVALRLSSSIQACQKGKKKQRPDSPNWPGFRSWKKSWFSLLYDEPTKGFKVNGNLLRLSLGVDKEGKRLSLSLVIKDSHLLKNRDIRNLRIIKENGLYFAVFTVRIKLPDKKPVKRIIALDPNHKNMAYGVDTEGNGIEIARPGFIKSYDRRIDELKAKRDRCSKSSKQINGRDIPSNRYQKYDRTLGKALRKRREQTKTFCYTLSNSLCASYDYIAIGNYTPHGGGINRKMRRAMNNRSLIGRFKEILKWTAEKSGKSYLEFDEKGTTRTCHHCGYIVEGGLSPSVREWDCPGCKIHHLRDENAAHNGLEKTIAEIKKSKTSVLQVPGSGLAFVKKQWAWCVFPSGIQEIPRGKDCNTIASSKKLNQKRGSF